MQIDFHHATTYVIARDAGFNHSDARIIAYAAQYVDGATSSDTVYFNNGAVFNRTCPTGQAEARPTTGEATTRSSTMKPYPPAFSLPYRTVGPWPASR